MFPDIDMNIETINDIHNSIKKIFDSIDDTL